MIGFFKSSIGRKVAMAASAFFLIIFLLQHFAINILSVFSPDMFNEVSHFMGVNPVVQFALQPVLIFAIIFHFVMGTILEIKNKKALGVAYVKNNGAANSSWMSRNMIWTGLMILAFLVLHLGIDFWIPEINTKYIVGDLSGLIDPNNAESGFRYYEELHHKFEHPLTVILYVVAFILLGMHLLHGFTSAFQSMGATVGRKKIMKQIGVIYSVAIPLGFVFIALYHHFNH